ncbi:MAG: TetR/AcrR family transcriptional regulator [Bacteroidales bacterium]|nr:TetR/AcrR family transcriptional regulator [Bacteroidales bacterium]
MEVRERILIESGLLFGKYGIKSMTMDSLAEKMGISKRTIYERFKDKDTLLKEVIKYYKKQSSNEAHRLIDQSDNAIEALFRIIKMTVNQMQRTSPAFFNDFKKYHQKVFKEFSEPGEMRDYSLTRKLLERGIEQEVFRSDFNIDLVNHTIHALFDLFGHDSTMIDAGFQHKEMFDHILVPFFRGISTKKGRKLLVECKPILE